MENENGEQTTLSSDENTELEPKSEGEEVDELVKAKELANNYKIRAEKAEAEAKKLKGESTPKNTEVAPKNEGLSLKDVKALQDIPEEDIDEVVEYAKYKGVSIAEIKKDSVMQGILRTRLEERKTAEATNTGGGRPSPSKASDETLLSKAEKGDLPESAEEIERLVDAKRKAMAKR